jgi:hypothetical protein
MESSKCPYCHREHLRATCPGCGAPGVMSQAEIRACLTSFSEYTLVLLKNGCISVNEARERECLEKIQDQLDLMDIKLAFSKVEPMQLR